MFRKVAGPLRVDTTATGGARSYALRAAPLGRHEGQAQYQVRVLNVSSTKMKLGLELHHGPTADHLVLHSTPIAVVAVPPQTEPVLSGDADTSKVFGTWLRAMVLTGSTDATPQWAQIEVHELLR